MTLPDLWTVRYLDIVWPRLYLHKFKAELSSNKYCLLSFICFKGGQQNLSTAKRKTSNPCPHPGSAAETFWYLIVSSSVKLKMIHFTGYYKNFCTSYKFCVLGVQHECKCKINITLQSVTSAVVHTQVAVPGNTPQITITPVHFDSFNWIFVPQVSF